MSGLIKRVKDYMSLVKFSHTVFAMPFALIGFVLAITSGEYNFSFRLLLLIILCMIFARNAAMGFNRLADTHYDALNPRTAGREIPTGKIAGKAAALFVAVNSLLFISAAALINNLTFWLSPVALTVILGYSFMKRITIMCHFVLGLGLSLAPIGAYISVTGRFEIIPLIYSFIVLTWVSGFDIIYALQDDEFDRNNRLFSIPAATGRKKAIIISSLLHAATFILTIAAGVSGEGSTFFWIGAGIFSTLLLYQHLIISPDDISRVNLAFGTTNGIASILFAIFVIADRLILYS
jgi:4-hydroxybenzoate polyprenyltransferase